MVLAVEFKEKVSRMIDQTSKDHSYMHVFGPIPYGTPDTRISIQIDKMENTFYQIQWLSGDASEKRKAFSFAEIQKQTGLNFDNIFSEIDLDEKDCLENVSKNTLLVLSELSSVWADKKFRETIISAFQAAIDLADEMGISISDIELFSKEDNKEVFQTAINFARSTGLEAKDFKLIPEAQELLKKELTEHESELSTLCLQAENMILQDLTPAEVIVEENRDFAH